MTDFNDFDLIDEAENLVHDALCLLERAVPTLMSVKCEELREAYCRDAGDVLKAAALSLSASKRLMDYSDPVACMDGDCPINGCDGGCA